MDLFDIVVAKALAGGGGGGGSSDFTIAQVTLFNATLGAFDVYGLPIVEDDPQYGSDIIGAWWDQIPSGQQLTLNVPIYKGTCFWATSLIPGYENFSFIAASGDITVDGDVTITGNGTINIESA